MSTKTIKQLADEFGVDKQRIYRCIRKYRTPLNTRRVLPLLLAAALALALAACAAKPPTGQHFSNPPTEAEIAEFRRTHLPNGESGIGFLEEGTESWSSDPVSAHLLQSFDVILTVKVIGERQNREIYIVESDRTAQSICYLVQVLDVLALSAVSSNYTEYSAGDTVFIQYYERSMVDMQIGEKYTIVGYNSSRYADLQLQQWNNENVFYWNEIPVIGTYDTQTFFVTESEYIIESVRQSSQTSHTGESAKDFKEDILAVSAEIGWMTQPNNTSANETN